MATHLLAGERGYRIVSSRFPPVGAFDRVASPADLDAVLALEGMTNQRLRQELGQLQLVPPERRASGPGTTPVMAAFTHPNPEGSRFSDGSYGVYYSALDRDTAIRETVHHRELLLRRTQEPPTRLEMRCYVATLHGAVDDIRGQRPDLHHPTDYAASRAWAAGRRHQGSNGALYDSVRHAGGTCAALFYPDLVRACTQSVHLFYDWDGQRITDVVIASGLLRL